MKKTIGEIETVLIAIASNPRKMVAKNHFFLFFQQNTPQ